VSELTVGEMIEVLKGLPQDLIIVATWEGLHVPITKKLVSVGAYRAYGPDRNINCVLIDVDVV